MTPQPGVRAVGLAVALASAAMFATSGSFARPLLESGWSPAAAVIVRLGLASLVLAPLAALALRGRWHVLRDKWRAILMYGLFGGAAVQVAYFNAITYIEVGVALMLEYLGVVLVVLYVWARTRRRPGPLTLVCHQQPSLSWDLGDTQGTELVVIDAGEDQRSPSCSPSYWLTGAGSS